MKDKQFTDEQLSMLADCILSKISIFREVADKVSDADLEELSRVKIGKLLTLLNYINA